MLRAQRVNHQSSKQGKELHTNFDKLELRLPPKTPTIFDSFLPSVEPQLHFDSCADDQSHSHEKSSSPNHAHSHEDSHSHTHPHAKESLPYEWKGSLEF